MVIGTLQLFFEYTKLIFKFSRLILSLFNFIPNGIGYFKNATSSF